MLLIQCPQSQAANVVQSLNYKDNYHKLLPTRTYSGKFFSFSKSVLHFILAFIITSYYRELASSFLTAHQHYVGHSR